MNCSGKSIMLKSKSTGDSRGNASLSNLKLLSTSRYSAITDNRLENIDEVLREIEGERHDFPNGTIPEAVIEQESTKIGEMECAEREHLQEESDDCNTTTEVSTDEIPVLMAIHYSNVQDIIGAVEGYLNNNRQLYGQRGSNMIVCEQCESTEVKHAEQIAEISKWRKSFMSSLNLKTVTYV